MSYAQNTIISANAANAYVAVLQGLLTSAGWTMVDSGTPSGSYRFQVWKSAAADNEAGYDWFLSIQWNSLGTEQTVDIIGGAAYDSTNKRISLIPTTRPDFTSTTIPDGYASTVDGDIWGWVAINLAVTASNTTTINSKGTISNTVKPWHSIITPSSAFAYWMSVTLDHVGLFTTIPNTYVVGTLDLAEGWAAAPFPVSTNPLFGASINGGSTPLEGVSASVIGTGSTNTVNLVPTNTRSANYGAPLPVIDGSYLDAFAWRPRYNLTALSGASTGVPTFDSPQFGDGYPIGDAIDIYSATAGAVGDTVVIGGATYVLTGPMGTSQVNARPCFAFLVE